MEGIQYIGDGVYVKFEGGDVVLMANSRESPTDTIYLEPGVYEALVRVVEQARAEASEAGS